MDTLLVRQLADRLKALGEAINQADECDICTAAELAFADEGLDSLAALADMLNTAVNAGRAVAADMVAEGGNDVTS